MATKKATKKSVKKPVRKDRRDNISTIDFLNVFTPMVRQGCTAEEIGKALERDATYVCVKASQLRMRARKQHEEGKIDDAKLAVTLANIPTLQSRGGSSLIDAIAALDFGTPQKEESDEVSASNVAEKTAETADGN